MSSSLTTSSSSSGPAGLAKSLSDLPPGALFFLDTPYHAGRKQEAGQQLLRGEDARGADVQERSGAGRRVGVGEEQDSRVGCVACCVIQTRKELMKSGPCHTFLWISPRCGPLARLRLLPCLHLDALCLVAHRVLGQLYPVSARAGCILVCLGLPVASTCLRASRLCVPASRRNFVAFGLCPFLF